MGYMRLHAIVVTSWRDLSEAHTTARSLFSAAQVSPISDLVVNDYRSFCVFPDGSKEGWEPSREGDSAREQFIAWLDLQRYADGSSPVRWVEVQYGDDNGETKVCTHSDEPSRQKPGTIDLTPDPRATL